MNLEATELCFLPAVTMRQMILDGEISCLELLEAHLVQQARCNEPVNAVITHTDDQARQQAVLADGSLWRRNRWDCCMDCRWPTRTWP